MLRKALFRGGQPKEIVPSVLSFRLAIDDLKKRTL